MIKDKDKETIKVYKELSDLCRSNSMMDSLIKEVRKKYISLGRLSGTVSIKVIEEEKNLLERLFSSNIEKETFSIKVKYMISQIKKTKYSVDDFHDFLEYYFYETIISKKEKEKSEEDKLNNLIASLKKEVDDDLGSFLELIKSNHPFTFNIKKLLREDEILSLEVIMSINKVIKTMKDSFDEKNVAKIRLALLSADVTGDPHYFDIGGKPGNILLNYLAWNKNVDKVPTYSEGKYKLLYDFGIIPDSLSSNTICYGVILREKNYTRSYSIDHQKNREPFVLTLSNLAKVTEALPQSHRVYVIENQMVFSELIDRINKKRRNGNKSKNNYSPTIICTSGQLKLASWILLDLIAKNPNVKILYSGDIDPEGLLIADKVLERYEIAEPWLMDKSSYEKGISNLKVNDRRMKCLANVKSLKLKEAIDGLMGKGLASYQEKLVGNMFEYIRLHNTKYPIKNINLKRKNYYEDYYEDDYEDDYEDNFEDNIINGYIESGIWENEEVPNETIINGTDISSEDIPF